MHESELKLNGLYYTPFNRGRSWIHTVKYIGTNRKGTKFYFEYLGQSEFTVKEATRVQVRQLTHAPSIAYESEAQTPLFHPSHGCFPEMTRKYDE